MLFVDCGAAFKPSYALLGSFARLMKVYRSPDTSTKDKESMLEVRVCYLRMFIAYVHSA